MANKEINSETLDKIDQKIGELWKIIEELTSMFKALSSQERVLAGGVLLQVRSPWGNKSVSALIGDTEIVAGLINQAVKEIQRPQAPQMPKIFQEDKDKLPN